MLPCSSPIVLRQCFFFFLFFIFFCITVYHRIEYSSMCYTLGPFASHSIYKFASARPTFSLHPSPTPAPPGQCFKRVSLNLMVQILSVDNLLLGSKWVSSETEAVPFFLLWENPQENPPEFQNVISSIFMISFKDTRTLKVQEPMKLWNYLMSHTSNLTEI